MQPITGIKPAVNLKQNNVIQLTIRARCPGVRLRVNSVNKYVSELLQTTNSTNRLKKQGGRFIMSTCEYHDEEQAMAGTNVAITTM